MDLLTKEEAYDFLENKLGITSFLEDFKTNRLAALNQIIRRFMETIPFHNIGLLATDPELRSAPTLKDSIKLCLLGEGGLCWSINSFMTVLLKVLGYTTYPVIASVGVNNNPDHIITIVKDLVKAGDTYLVDVGFGRPFSEAICLDFEQESKLYRHALDTYKYVNRADCFIRLSQFSKHSITNYPVMEGEFCHAYYFNTSPDDFGYIEEYMDKYVWKNPKMVFWRTLRAVVFAGGAAVAIKDNVILKENEERRIIATPIERKNMLKTFRKMFPCVNPELVKRAVDNWEKYIAPTLDK